jgi:hypothetical protein
VSNILGAELDETNLKNLFAAKRHEEGSTVSETSGTVRKKIFRTESAVRRILARLQRADVYST